MYAVQAADPFKNKNDMTTPIKPLKLFSTIALRNILKTVLPGFETASGRKTDIEYGATAQLSERIQAGERGDLIMAVSTSIDDLIHHGILQQGSRIDMVASDIGMAVRQGASAPDISTVEALVATLLATPSIVYSRQGASGLYFASLLRKLGIEERVAAKATILPEGLTGEVVAKGQAVLAVQQISELLQVPGINIFAKLPAAVQQSTILSIGTFQQTTEQLAVKELIAYMRTPTVIQAMESQGLDPL